MAIISTIKSLLRVAAIGIGTVAVIGASAYWLRVPLIKGLFAVLSDEQAITLQQLQGLSIDAGSIRIDRVTLRTGKAPTTRAPSAQGSSTHDVAPQGAPQQLRDIVLHYALVPPRPIALHIGRADLSLAQAPETSTQAEPVEIAAVLKTIGAIPLERLHIDTLSVQNFADSLQLHWQRQAAVQQLALSHAPSGHHLRLILETATPFNARLQWRQNRQPLLKGRARLLPPNTGDAPYQLEARVPALQPAHLLRALHPLAKAKSPWLNERTLVELTGRFDLRLTAQLPQRFTHIDDVDWALQLTAPQAPQLTLDTTAAPGAHSAPAELALPERAKLRVQLAQAVTISQAGQTHGVSVDAPSITASLSAPDQHDTRLSLQALRCRYRGAVQCRGQFELDTRHAGIALSEWSADNIELTATGDIAWKDAQLQLTLNANSTLGATALNTAFADANAPRLVIDAPLQAQLDGARQQLRLDAQALDLQLPRLNRDTTTLATRLHVSAATATLPLHAPAQAKAEMRWRTDTLQWQFGDQSFPPLALAGRGTLHNQQIHLQGRVNTDKDRPLLALTGSHHLATQQGKVELNSERLALTPDSPLPAQFNEWPYQWSLQRGDISLHSTLRWEPAASGLTLQGQLNLQAQQLDGAINDMALLGGDVSAQLRLDSDGAVRSATPITVSAQRIDAGVAIEQFAAQAAIDTGTATVSLHSLSAEWLDGKLLGHPADYHLETGSGELLFTVMDLSLAELVALSPTPGLEVTGRIDGALPITLRENTPTMAGGWVAADPPSGVIRYRPPAGTSFDDPTLKLVMDALSNYHYHSLRGYADYAENGNLYLRLRLKGRNPDMEADQPIHFNPSLTNNIPRLLEALQASRAVPEVLERRFSQ